MDSFIPWIGGKKLLRKEILKRFPADKIGNYVEVFGGAGWVLFAKEILSEKEVFNDFDGLLINLYRCIKYHQGELQREILGIGANWIPNSRELFCDYKEQIKGRGLTDIQRAARYFLIIRQSFGANRSSFGIYKKIAIKSLQRFPEIAARLQNVVIENKDFEALIKAYDCPETLFYLDPPYYQTEKYYEGFSLNDHIRLNQALRHVKGRFILSYNEEDYIREIYSGFKIETVRRGNNLSSGQYAELIIMNY